MPKRRATAKEYISQSSIPHRDDPPSLARLAIAAPVAIDAIDKSIIKKAQERPDWSKYRIETRDGNPFIVREKCDRCGKITVVPAWRKIRAVTLEEYPDLGTIYVETGLCKDCINAATYMDYYLDGEPLTFKESLALFTEYAVEYERNWRIVLAAAPRIVITNEEWDKACKFFNGCAFCGGPIDVRAMYFPRMLNGEHTAWNVIPLCAECRDKHYAGRKDVTKTPKRYKVFSTLGTFNKQKTTRVYLLEQMRLHGVYMDPLLPFMQRFRETLILKGSD